MSIKKSNAKDRASRPKPPFNPNPDKDSNRSKKRRARGFKSLIQSSRIHRRAEKRLAIGQTINNRRYPAGETVDQPYGAKSFTQHAAGRVKHHNG
jgi:hypothetical protein